MTIPALSALIAGAAVYAFLFAFLTTGEALVRAVASAVLVFVYLLSEKSR